MYRRELLAVGGGTLAALAGCTGGDHDVPPATGTLAVRADGLSAPRTVEVFVVDAERGESVLADEVTLGAETRTRRWSVGRGTFHVQVAAGTVERTYTWDVTDSTRLLAVDVGETGVEFTTQTRNVGR